MTYFLKRRQTQVFVLILTGWLILTGILLLPPFQTSLQAENCNYDYRSDGDTDGLDLYEFIQNFSILHAWEFAEDFGRTDCDVACRELLPCDMDAANACFSSAVLATGAPTDKAFHALTRILALIYDPDINAMLTQLGMAEEVRTFCNWTAGWQTDEFGEPILPEQMPSSGSMFRLMIDKLLPEINGALTELADIDSTIADPFIVLCEEFQSPDAGASCENLEVDYGDIALYRALLYFMKAFLLVIDAYDMNIEDTAGLIQALKNDLFIINNYLCDDITVPTCLGATLLTPKGGADALLAEAKTAFRNAIDSYMDASVFILNEPDDQENDLIAKPEDLEAIEDEARFRAVLSDIRDALDGPAAIGEGSQTVDYPFDMDLTRFFDYPLNIRASMPAFTADNMPICGSFDPTLGGILPEFTSDDYASGFGMQVPVTGDVSCAAGLACGNIRVGAFYWNSYNSSPGQLIASDSLSSPGAYEISVRADSEDVIFAAYWDKDADGMLSPGDYTGSYPLGPIDIASSQCAGPSGIDILISNQVIGIKGRITSNGQPVSNIQVFLHAGPCQNVISSAVTNENGIYVVTAPSTTQAYLYIQPRQHIQGWWNGSAVVQDCNQAAMYHPSDGQTVVDMVVEAADSISGTVRDTHGNPVSWAWIQAWDYVGYAGSWLQGTPADENGAYTLYLTQPYSGTCILQAEQGNGNYIREYYDNKYRQSEATPIVVDPEPGVHHLSGIDFQLEPGGQISGGVTDSSNSPIVSVWVYAAEYYTGDWYGGTYSGEDGKYVISCLPTGTYRMTAYPDSTTGYLYEYYDNVRDPSSATPVSVTVGQTVLGINFSLEALP
ncbi:MAG: carboxypeptidase regulatory-like domain-containing protein [Proteobacteria bacterium]|nr:carboxypeptidase regulatory-like domain-containing protein [Pseudomonadota bacterium]